MDAVTVITLTRQRPQLLRRAIASVLAQDYDGPIAHLVIADDCPATTEVVGSITPPGWNRSVRLHHQPRAPFDVETTRRVESVYPRIAHLLNMGIAMADSRWVAFLDDDNEFDLNHISSLVSCALRYTCPAVHSGRRIYHHDGRPYLEPLFPWAPNPAEGARIFELMCSRGVWVRHTNILRDRAGVAGLGPFRNSTVLSERDPVFMVDTSVWLLERCLMTRHPVPEHFTRADINDNTAPDDKLLDRLLHERVRIVSTGLPTLRYYLGGISN